MYCNMIVRHLIVILPKILQTPLTWLYFAVWQSAQDDKATIRCETSPPTTPRSMRLNREAGHAASHEDIRDIRG